MAASEGDFELLFKAFVSRMSTLGRTARGNWTVTVTRYFKSEWMGTSSVCRCSAPGPPKKANSFTFRVQRTCCVA